MWLATLHYTYFNSLKHIKRTFPLNTASLIWLRSRFGAYRHWRLTLGKKAARENKVAQHKSLYLIKFLLETTSLHGLYAIIVKYPNPLYRQDIYIGTRASPEGQTWIHYVVAYRLNCRTYTQPARKANRRHVSEVEWWFALLPVLGKLALKNDGRKYSIHIPGVSISHQIQESILHS